MREFLSTVLMPILRLGTPTGPTVTPGTGSPEGVLSAPVGSQYLRTDGSTGTTLYVKESGAGNTGWRAIAPGSGAAPDIGPTYTTKSTTPVALTLADTVYQIFSGATAGQTVSLPLPATAPEGTTFIIVNEEGASISVNGASLLAGRTRKLVRGFDIDGVTEAWVREFDVVGDFVEIVIDRLSVFSGDDNREPLRVVPSDTLVEGSLNDGAIWATSTGLKTKIGGTVYDLTISANNPRITVGTTAPTSPAVGELWVDTN